jgi:hypothetical protein
MSGIWRREAPPRCANPRTLDQDQGLHRHFRAQAIELKKSGAGMSATEIAERHFSAAMAEAERGGTGHDAVCRALLSLVVAKYLESRALPDVQSELRFVADNCDPDTDFAFMRP